MDETSQPIDQAVTNIVTAFEPLMSFFEQFAVALDQAAYQAYLNIGAPYGETREGAARFWEELADHPALNKYGGKKVK